MRIAQTRFKCERDECVFDAHSVLGSSVKGPLDHYKNQSLYPSEAILQRLPQGYNMIHGTLCMYIPLKFDISTVVG